MKALIRNEGETVTEDMGHDFIDWGTGAPLTNPKWFGGAYTLVQNYVAPQENEPESYEIVETPAEPVVEDEDEYVVIDGKRYSKEELRRLLE